ncbi:hypothetical protein [Methylibium sp.]|uniref:hypothetical protein n=1 Tax=Methylibium sp. TaxID=2067992 RepID=UPI003BAD4686
MHPGEDAVRFQSKWIAPTLLNSWVNFSAAFNPAGYFRDQFGIVRLRGLVKDGSAANAVIFTLPTGYRPAFQTMFAVISGSILGRVDVLANGDVQMISGGSVGFVSLDAISFQVA